jgi:hypothetical protein
MKPDQEWRPKRLERENARLRPAVAEPTLDKQVLQEAAKGPSTGGGVVQNDPPGRAEPGGSV